MSSCAPIARGATAALALTVLTALIGCGGTVPESRIYSIDTTYGPAETSAAQLALTLQIPPFSSSDIYTDRRIAWRDRAEPYRIRLMDNNLWSSAPAHLVQEQLLQCVRQSGIYRSVVPSGISVRIDQVLQGEVKRFEFVGEGDVLSDVVLEVDLVLTGREPRRLLWQGSFRHDGKLAGDTGGDAVEAMVSGFHGLCRQTLATLRSLAAGRGEGS